LRPIHQCAHRTSFERSRRDPAGERQGNPELWVGRLARAVSDRGGGHS
jgi:hypothetical protein